MAKKILPYRDYSEHDVVNAFSLATSANPIGDNDAVDHTLTSWKQGSTDQVGGNDAGVVVSVKAGSLPGDSPAQSTDSSENLRDYLGATHSSAHIGYSSYPYNDMVVEPASGQAPALGITLRETLAYDENGEKMLYYPQKLDEAQGVLPGQSVPVLTRGTILMTRSAFDADPTLGSYLEPASAPGDAGLLSVQAAISDNTVGHIIATGMDSDVSANAHVLCKLSFNGGK